MGKISYTEENIKYKTEQLRHIGFKIQKRY